MDFGNPVSLFALLALVFSVAFVGYGFMLSGSQAALSTGGFSHSDTQYQEFVSAELEDKCAVPEGYDEAAWKQHMSHHPDRYEGCDF